LLAKRGTVAMGVEVMVGEVEVVEATEVEVVGMEVGVAVGKVGQQG
jgi:hypothetical protein